MKLIRGSEIEFVPASHEDTTNPSVLKRVLAKREDLIDGRVQMLNWSRLRPAAAFRTHYHESMQEVFVITQGTARITIDNQSLQLGAGDAVIIDCREVHTMENTGNIDVEYLCFGISNSQTGKTVLV